MSKEEEVKEGSKKEEGRWLGILEGKEEGQDDAVEEIEEEEEEEEAGKVQEENGNKDKEDPRLHSSCPPLTMSNPGKKSLNLQQKRLIPNKKNHPLLLVFLKMVLKNLLKLLYWYFGMLGKNRRRYKRAYQARSPSLEQQIVDHLDQDDAPREYYIVKERKPRSTPIKRRKKHAGHRRAGVRRRMIIDIHLEILDECQKGDLHWTKEDFFEILVQEFMGSEFIKEEDFAPKEVVPRECDTKERVLSSDSGFREGTLCS
ncbi:SICA antigen [Plasmodium coatneyi]|uniref:SICA antigen n=1 Tax=Plasmodium coatneyi TaxID=208452 RepID=A0A1B1E4X8_9APIC|nr:SICA antigen [Plasmodium coatneyi]ANQ10084.1 SICA antigen [Plasmodium coatneyi]